MPRKNPISEREKQICARLAEFRTRIKLSRAAFAREIDMDQFRLASYEHGRAPVRFSLALTIQEVFHINMIWLATGVGPMAGNPLFNWEFVPEPGMLLSEACDKHLLPTATPGKGVPVNELFPFGVPLPEFYAQELAAEFRDDLKKLPSKHWLAFHKSIRDAAKAALDTTPTRSKKSAVDNITFCGNSQDVKLTMATLLARLNKATEAHGMKSKLAKYMEVPLPNVSQWLSGEREPSGDNTLRLLYWVEQQEQKK